MRCAKRARGGAGAVPPCVQPELAPSGAAVAVQTARPLRTPRTPSEYQRSPFRTSHARSDLLRHLKAPPLICGCHMTAGDVTCVVSDTCAISWWRRRARAPTRGGLTPLKNADSATLKCFGVLVDHALHEAHQQGALLAESSGREGGLNGSMN